ncbi:MAG: F0F1 ATP synthase subunit A [Candidatus Latescibacteria bacterium]|nr:F0F1 ATP synthase subunit A [Candidatus Latescibacterota bacterium]
MASETHAADGTVQVDFIGHILDKPYLEVPLLNAHHYLDGKIPLPQFEPIFGIDLSITRHVFMMWVAGALLISLMLIAFRRSSLVPSGLGNFFEAIVLFIRDDVVLPIMGEHGRPFLPYMLTIFFFILFCNLIGLVPYSATATGNINVTAGLAVCTFILTQVTGIANNGLFGYLKHLSPPGVPLALAPLLVLVELMGLFIKPLALCIRLFANMTAGHLIIVVALGFTIVFQTLWLAPISVAFAAAIYLLEIFIAFVQAYIFTLLSAIFISMAAHPDH